MALAGQDDDISGLSVMDGPGNRLFSVGNLNKTASGPADAGTDIRNDIQRLFKSGVVGGDDRQVGQAAADFAHLKAPGLGPVAAAAEYTDQTVGIVFPQGRQQAFQSHGVMGIVDHQGKFAGNRDHFDPSPDFDLQQGFADVFRGHAEMPADGNGAKGIVYTESAGRGHLSLKVHQAADPEGYAQFTGLVDQGQVLCPQVILRAQSETLYRAGMAFQYFVRVFVIAVDDTDPALLEEQALTLLIILEILMLSGTDMIGGEIGKDTIVKDKALGPVQHQGLGRDLHNDRLNARVRHILKDLLQGQGFGGGVGGRNPDIAVQGLDRADQTYFEAGALQDGPDHVGGRGLSLGACNADDLHAGRGIAEPRGRDKGHGITGIIDTDDDRVPGRLAQIQILLHDQGLRPVLQCLQRKITFPYVKTHNHLTVSLVYTIVTHTFVVHFHEAFSPLRHIIVRDFIGTYIKIPETFRELTFFNFYRHMGKGTRCISGHEFH